MRQLIVNADDFNTDGERNRGILEAARQGIVTSTSVLTNVGWPEGARDGLLEVFGASIGVHLNLTKGRPISADVPSLTRPDGSFFPKPAAWRRALAGSFDPQEAEREFIAQIRALYQAGIAPDHVDGNNHLHVFPGLAKAAAGAAAMFGLRRIRLPREPIFWSLRRPGRQLVKKCFICLMALQAEKVFRRAGLCFPQRCAGLHTPQTGSAREIENFLLRLPEGATELICHPGYASSLSAFSTPEREQELQALTAPEVLRAVTQHDINLIPFSDLPCA